ncbi:MAG: putative Ig domain-containing protein, partial [Planctomycetes bacterium]|nr:putative Ig domain-containing protein [Planctomycetota bacterium]
MTLLNPFPRWTSSLLTQLEQGRKRRIRRERESGPVSQTASEIETLEKRALLSSSGKDSVLTVMNPPPVVKTTTLQVQVASIDEHDSHENSSDSLRLSLVQTSGPTIATGIKIQSSTGVLTWTPGADQAAGSYGFNVILRKKGSSNPLEIKPLQVQVLSAGIVNQNLVVVGTSLSDAISVSSLPSNGIAVGVNSECYVFNGAKVTGTIKISGFQGDDTLNVAGAIGHPYSINVAGDADTLIVEGTSHRDVIALSNNQVVVNGNSISYNTISHLVVNAIGGDDSVSMTGNAAPPCVTVDGSGGFNDFTATLT